MTQQTELSVEWIAIDAIIPYARNPRRFGDAVDKVAASLHEFGFRQPIVIDADNIIVAGHVRYEAAKRLGMERVPVHRADALTPQQIRAYRLADNRSAQEAAWDDELLALELQELHEGGADMHVTGFSVMELDRYLDDTDVVDTPANDIAPDPPDVPLTQRGDVLQLGRHRLVCGDAMDARAYELLLGAGKVDMVYTDPPYNVDYHGSAGSISNDNMSRGGFYLFLQQVCRQLYARLKAGGAAYVSYSEKETENFYRALREAGFKQSSCLIWVKNQLVLGRGDYHSQHEPIWYGWKPGAKHAWHGGRKQTTLEDARDIVPVTRLSEGCYSVECDGMHLVIRGDNLSIEAVESGLIRENKPQHSPLHPTMKPVGLIERVVKNSSARNGVVLDVFGGSGTTLIACDALGRQARLLEMDPRYCDVIIQRWQERSGQKAIHSITGQEFARS